LQGHNAPELNQDGLGQCVLVEFGFVVGAFDGFGCEVRVLEFGNAGTRELEFLVSLGPSRVGDLPGRVVGLDVLAHLQNRAWRRVVWVTLGFRPAMRVCGARGRTGSRWWTRGAGTAL
jgi:hypothetical protein